ncbi:unnamed protein product [Heligmosomoides polygyrus]|uniref:DNA2/NAM7 helicase helicase domain-containing protein n=1 Tax=Heligmosomoides polygyrus TaxID=6339 RepID=A0A183FQ98_HELPZ|nr:unnamed protein product [Heligmosomoides polygyrus]
MGLSNHPIVVIQAAYRSGKTVVGPFLAVQIAAAAQNLVIVTATLNVAFLQFVADSVLAEGAPRTRVDLHTILPSLVELYVDKLEAEKVHRCQIYNDGGRLQETLVLSPDAALHLSDEEREEYQIAEQENSDATEDAVKVMLRERFPSVVCITTVSLLNTTSLGGLFYELQPTSTVLISDEASNIPELAFVAIASRFPQARHIVSLPEVVSTCPARGHRNIPLAFADIKGASYPSPSSSYWNENEAGRCKDIICELLALKQFELLDEPKRMNVAITMCRHGQFILGRSRALGGDIRRRYGPAERLATRPLGFARPRLLHHDPTPLADSTYSACTT